METRIQEFFKIDYSHTKVGRQGDVLIVFFNDGKFWLCDKDYGIQGGGSSQRYRVKRIFTGNGGKSTESVGCVVGSDKSVESGVSDYGKKES